MVHAISRSFHQTNPQVMRSTAYVPTTDIVEIATRSLFQLGTLNHFEHGRPYSFHALAWTSKMHIILSTQALLTAGTSIAIRLVTLKMIQGKIHQIFPHLDFSTGKLELAIKRFDRVFERVSKTLESPDLSEASNDALLQHSEIIADVSERIFEVHEELRGILFSLLESPELVTNKILFTDVMSYVLSERHEAISAIVNEKLKVARQNVMNLVEEMRTKLKLYIKIQAGLDFFKSEVAKLSSRSIDKDLREDIKDAAFIQANLNDGSFLDVSVDELQESIESVENIVERFLPE